MSGQTKTMLEKYFAGYDDSIKHFTFSENPHIEASIMKKLPKTPSDNFLSFVYEL
jgi:hypothetical protein